MFSAGGLGVAYQLSWLLVSAGPPAACAVAGVHCGSIRTLLVGLVASRTGMWVFDLTLSQLMQEEIPVEELATVSGTHNAICAALSTSMYVAGIALHRPEDFGILMAFSLLAVGASATIYWSWAFPQLRGQHGGGGGGGGPLSGLGLGLLWNRAGAGSYSSAADSAGDSSEEGIQLLTEEELRSCRSSGPRLLQSSDENDPAGQARGTLATMHSCSGSGGEFSEDGPPLSYDGGGRLGLLSPPPPPRAPRSPSLPQR